MCEPSTKPAIPAAISDEESDPLDVPCVLFNMITPELREELDLLKLVFERPGMSDADVIREAVLHIKQTTLTQSLNPGKDIRTAMGDLRAVLKLSEIMDDYTTVFTATSVIRMHLLGAKALAEAMSRMP